MKEIILETKGLTRYFGGVTAVTNLGLSIMKGTVWGLIGPNGAGKTTLLNLITGSILPSKGKVFFNGQDITHLKPEQIAQKGIGRIFQITRLFRDQTVLHNMVIANHLRSKAGFWSELVTSRQALQDWRGKRDNAKELLQWIGLSDKEDNIAGTLSILDQKLLSIGLTLALNPGLLLLDEPTAGLNEDETNKIGVIIQDLRNDKAITILIIEHKMRFIMGLCEYVTVLNEGSVLAVGTPKEIVDNEDVVRVYLGKGETGIV